jgi:hypothetical protein
MVLSVATEKILNDTVRLVAQCLNHYATPGPTFNLIPTDISREYAEYYEIHTSNQFLLINGFNHGIYSLKIALSRPDMASAFNWYIK